MVKKVRIIIVAVFVFVVSSVSMAQLTEPGDGAGGDPNGSGTPVGGGAPIGSGVVLMTALSALYLGRKTYVFSMKSNI